MVCPYVFYEMCINSNGTYSLCRFDWKDVYKRQVYQQMVKKLASYKTLTGRKKAAKANPKIAALQVELAHVDGEIEKLVDSLTGANNVLLLSLIHILRAERGVRQGRRGRQGSGRKGAGGSGGSSHPVHLPAGDAAEG